MATKYDLLEFLHSQQSRFNHDLFSEQYGIFLGAREQSKVYVVCHLTSTEEQPTLRQEEPNNEAISISLSSQQGRHLKDAGDVRSFFSQQHPSFAFLEIGQQHSRSRIDVTGETFDQLADSIGIFSDLKDAIMYFGFRVVEIEVAPPRPRHRIFAEGTECNPQGFETVYGLRFMELNCRNGGNPWSLRQCVVYNQTRYNRHTSQWLFFSLPEAMSRETKALVTARGESIIPCPFEIHVILITLAIQMWRPYFAWAVERADEYRSKVRMADEQGQDQFKLDASLSKILNTFQDEINDAILALKATSDAVNFLRDVHHKTAKFNKIDCHHTESHYETLMTDVLVERHKDLEMLQNQAAVLLTKLRTYSETITSFLNLANSHTLYRLNVESSLEARAVKSLSIITVIYLPLTVVLNFFSAAFVNTAAGSIQLVGDWWIFVVVALPLTIFTLLVWAVWTHRMRFQTSMFNFKWIASVYRRCRSNSLSSNIKSEKEMEAGMAKALEL